MRRTKFHVVNGSRGKICFSLFRQIVIKGHTEQRLRQSSHWRVEEKGDKLVKSITDELATSSVACYLLYTFHADWLPTTARHVVCWQWVEKIIPIPTASNLSVRLSWTHFSTSTGQEWAIFNLCNNTILFRRMYEIWNPSIASCVSWVCNERFIPGSLFSVSLSTCFLSFLPRRIDVSLLFSLFFLEKPTCGNFHMMNVVVSWWRREKQVMGKINFNQNIFVLSYRQLNRN